jgi:hypothetical protein
MDAPYRLTGAVSAHSVHAASRAAARYRRGLTGGTTYTDALPHPWQAGINAR